MSKTPLFVQPGALIEVTARTVGARFLLRPCLELNTVIVDVLARALVSLPIALHAFAFLSNHWHALLSVADALAQCRFIQRLNGEIASTVNRLHKWEGQVFSRATVITVGASSEEDRLRYLLAQGAKEGLVRRPTQWPGVHSARALLNEEILESQRTWIGKQRCTNGTRERSVRERSRVDLSPIPSWESVPALDRLARLRTMVDEIERDAAERHPIPLGIKRILSQDPLESPENPKRGIPPRIHTNDPEEREQYENRRLDFDQAFSEAKANVHAQRPALLPPGCFPPVVPFRHASSVLRLTSGVQQSATENSLPDSRRLETVPNRSAPNPSVHDADARSPEDEAGDNNLVSGSVASVA